MLHGKWLLYMKTWAAVKERKEIPYAARCNFELNCCVERERENQPPDIIYDQSLIVNLKTAFDYSSVLNKKSDPLLRSRFDVCILNWSKTSNAF